MPWRRTSRTTKTKDARTQPTDRPSGVHRGDNTGGSAARNLREPDRLHRRGRHQHHRGRPLRGHHHERPEPRFGRFERIADHPDGKPIWKTRYHRARAANGHWPAKQLTSDDGTLVRSDTIRHNLRLAPDALLRDISGNLRQERDAHWRDGSVRVWFPAGAGERRTRPTRSSLVLPDARTIGWIVDQHPRQAVDLRDAVHVTMKTVEIEPTFESWQGRGARAPDETQRHPRRCDGTRRSPSRQPSLHDHPAPAGTCQGPAAVRRSLRVRPRRRPIPRDGRFSTRRSGGSFTRIASS